MSSRLPVNSEGVPPFSDFSNSSCEPEVVLPHYESEKQFCSDLLNLFRRILSQNSDKLEHSPFSTLSEQVCRFPSRFSDQLGRCPFQFHDQLDHSPFSDLSKQVRRFPSRFSNQLDRFSAHRSELLNPCLNQSMFEQTLLSSLHYGLMVVQTSEEHPQSDSGYTWDWEKNLGRPRFHPPQVLRVREK